MRSTFMGLSIINSGLFMSRKQIDVSGHNIANANTPGFTRQIVIPTAVDPLYGNRILQTSAKGIVGGGTKIMSLNQIRDIFLDRQYRAQNSQFAMWETRSQGLYFIEDIFNGIGDTSLDSLMSNFFDAFQELSKNPNSREYRTILSEAGKNMAKAFNDYYEKLISQQEEQNQSIETQTKQINDMLEQIVQLNKDILKFEQSGNLALDLRDKRNLLIDELSGLINITYKYVEVNGGDQLQIFIGNEMLVDHTERATLECVADAPNMSTGEENKFYSLYLNPIGGGPAVKLTNTGTFTPATYYSHEIQFTGAASDGFITLSVAGYNDVVFQVQNGDSASTVAQKAMDALNAAFDGSFTVEHNGATLKITSTVSGSVSDDVLVNGKDTTFSQTTTLGAALSDGTIEITDGTNTYIIPVEAGNAQLTADKAASTLNADSTFSADYVAVADGDKLMITAKASGRKGVSFTVNDTGETGVTAAYDALTDQASGAAGTADLTSVIDGTAWSYSEGADILTSGEMRAYFDLRDGSSKTNQGIPFFLRRLDTLAKAFVEEINLIHRSGHTGSGLENNKQYSSRTGVNFFDPTGVTAATIRLSDDVMESVFNIAASSSKVEIKTGQMTGNNQLALLLAALKEEKDLDNVGGFESYFKSFLSEMASEVRSSNNMLESNTILLQSISNQKESVSGVSLDEEMTELIRFQHAYSAASRCLTVMDEALDVLINRTGRVGL